MALFAKKTGPEKVEVAFGLFTKAINDLEAAVDSCKTEEAGLKQVAANALAEAELRKVAGAKAVVAVKNLKELLGG